jgi:hypothetical protein
MGLDAFTRASSWRPDTAWRRCSESPLSLDRSSFGRSPRSHSQSLGACLRSARLHSEASPARAFRQRNARMKAFRLAMARALIEVGLWTLGSLAEDGVLFLKGEEIMFFRCNGQIETRKRTLVD